MKEKYKLKTKIGQRVSKIEIGIRAESDKHQSTSINKEGVFVGDHKIVYQTYWKIALNNKWITLLDRQRVDQKKESYNQYLEYPSVSVVTKESYFPRGIFGIIYTIGDSRKAIVKLIEAMQTKVDKEYGYMFNIDIGDIVEGYLDSGNF